MIPGGQRRDIPDKVRHHLRLAGWRIGRLHMDDDAPFSQATPGTLDLWSKELLADLQEGTDATP